MVMGIIGSIFIFLLRIFLAITSAIIRLAVWLISGIFVGIFRLILFIAIKVKKRQNRYW